MEPKAGTKVSDRVTLVEPLASGSMGSVWIGEHETLKTRVAVKLLPTRTKDAHASASKRFALEASAAARISSPHVVRMFDHGVTRDGTMFIVMELLKGESLAEHMERLGALPLDEIVTIVAQTCRALSAAHALELVHRDIKPANIFLTEEHGEPLIKVLDFGVVKSLAGGPDSPKLSEPGMLLGTPAYMSPDMVLSGGGKAGPQADLWSLSVVTYRCVTGKLPFLGDTAADVLKSIVAGQFKKPSELRRGLKPEVDAWFARALNKEPEKRFGDANELASTFRALFVKKGRRQPAPLLIGAVALAATIAVLAVWSSRQPQPARSSASPSVPVAAGTTTASISPAPAVPSVAPVDPAVLAALAQKARKAEVFVPPGVAWVECTSGDCPHRSPAVPLEPFYVDRTEVTVMDYAKCTVEDVCNSRRVQGPTVEEPTVPESARCNWHQVGREHHPMNCLSYAQAENYCVWRGGRLPSEAEWVRAARGAEKRLYPWGDELASCERTVLADEDGEGCGRGSAWKAGARPEDVSPFGARDLGGNLREWVSDWYDPASAEASKRRRVVKGGSWGDRDPKALGVNARTGLVPTDRSVLVGFRCVRSAR